MPLPRLRRPPSTPRPTPPAPTPIPRPKPSTRRVLRRAAWTGGAFGALLLVALLAVVFDPTLLRPWIQHAIHSRSGRTIDFTAMHLGLDADLDPRLAFDDLKIDNAAWATSREPLVQGRRVILHLNWAGLTTGAWVVKRLELEDTAVDLERDKDGRRNARLSSADGRGPVRAVVLSVDGRRSRLRISDAVTGLELRIRSTPLPAPRVLEGLAKLPLTRTLDFDGRQRGTAFTGRADVSDLLTLQRTGERFAVQGELRTDAARLTLAGAVADVLALGAVDADLHLDADPLSGLHPGLLPKLPPLRQVSVDAHLLREARRWQVTRLQAKSRGSAVEGSLEVRQPGTPAERLRVDATLRARRLDLDEARAARGPETARVVAGKAAGTASAQPGATRPDTPSPAASAAFDWRGLGRLDAALDLGIAEVVLADAVVAKGAALKATLERSRLDIALADTVVAGGRASGEVRLDAASAPASASLRMRLADVRLRDLPPAWVAETQRQVQGGNVSATASVEMRGGSVAEWIASSNGNLRASLDGAKVSDRLEAKLGLDGFAFLRSLVSGADAVPLRCAEFALDLKGGHGTVRRLTLDTPRTAVAGKGSIDFVGRTVDIVLAPSSHVAAPFALERDIRIQGPFAKPHASLETAGARPAPATCNGG